MSRNHKETVYVHHKGKSNRHNRLRSCTRDVLTCHVTIRKPSMSTTGGPSSSCEMIILRNNSHGGIIRVCMGIFTAALRNKIIRQILKKIPHLLHSWSLGRLCVYLWGLWEQEYLQECKECEIWTKETESQHWTKMAAREGKEVDFSQIKNKQRRSSLYQKEKLKKAKEKRDRKRKRKQEESQEEGEVRQWKKN